MSIFFQPSDWKSIEYLAINALERFHRLFLPFLNILPGRKTWEERRVDRRTENVAGVTERETDVTGMTKKVISTDRNPVTGEIEDATESH